MLRFELARGEDALAKFNDPAFAAEWRRLLGACPWATVFQSPAFFVPWFRHYADAYEPLLALVYGTDRLVCAFPGARRRDDGLLVGAGHYQAEYQCWLCEPQQTEQAGLYLAEALSEQFPGSPWHLKYVPSHPVLRSGLDSLLAQGRTAIETWRRPLHRFSAQSAAKSLRKKSNKSKLNRLARSGPVSFYSATDAEQRRSLLDEIIPYYELRQGAVNDSFPFTDDTRKRAFHVDLLQSLDGDMSLTVTRAGSEFVAGLVGFRSEGVLSVGMIAYSPMYAAHSPGKFHLLLGAMELDGEGIHTIDLTPGGDAWKDRFATEFDEVYELHVFPDRAALRRRNRTRRVAGTAKSLLSLVGVTGPRVRALRGGLASSLPWLRTNLWRRSGYCVYRGDVEEASGADAGFTASVNSIYNLVRFVSCAQARQAFFAQSLARLEAGHRIYTIVEGGAPRHYGWLTEGESEAMFDGRGLGYRFPQPAAVLYDFYTVPEARGQGFCRSTMRRMLADVGAAGELRWAYVVTPSDNAACIRAAEGAGFRPVAALNVRVLLGRRRAALARGHRAGDLDEDVAAGRRGEASADG